MRRQMQAVALVMGLLCLIPCADVLATNVIGADAAQAEALPMGVQSAFGANDAEGALDRIDAQLAKDESALPVELEGEIALLPDACDMRVGGSGDIFGYTVARVDEEALASIERCMEELGWTSVPMGGVCGSTFVRSTGHCRWAMAVCTQVGDKTSVVMRCVVA